MAGVNARDGLAVPDFRLRPDDADLSRLGRRGGSGVGLDFGKIVREAALFST